MRRHPRFRGPRRFGPRPFFGGIWFIVLLMVLLGGRYWPLILIVIGLGVVFSSMFKEPTPPPPPPPLHPMNEPFPSQAAPASTPAEPIHRTDLLPTNCPQCGGPIRSYEVKWTGNQSAACPYCGSNLPMRKS